MSAVQMKTEPMKQCHSCSAQLPEYDNFCRCCGIVQRAAGDLPAQAEILESEPAVSVQKPVSQTLSSQLVISLTRNVALKTTPLRETRVGTKVVAGLMVLPIWLLIILLSPVEAYTAARAATRQMTFE